MDKFLTLADSDRADVFQETAKRMQLHPTPVEKDFWVCYLLRELFNLECVKDHLIFKGGTSLSKCYGIIERFSEDLDVKIESSDLPPVASWSSEGVSAIEARAHFFGEIETRLTVRGATIEELATLRDRIGKLC